MRKIKLFLSVVIAVSLIAGSISCIATTAVQADYVHDTEILFATGIIGDRNGFLTDEAITRDEATAMVMRLVGYTNEMAEYNNEFIDVDDQNPNAVLLKVAVNLGIAKRMRTSPSAFAPNGKVSFNDAGSMLLNALGYSFSEGSTNYLTKMNQIKDGVILKDSKALTKGEMAQLVLNAGQMPVVKQVVFGERTAHELDEDVTALSLYHDIHLIEGTVTANMYTSLYNTAVAKENHIEIDGISVSCEEGSDVHKMLGMEISAFCKMKNDSKTPSLICYEYNENQKYEIIDGEDIISYSNRTYKYYSEKDKKEQVKISKNSVVIYNGMALSDDMLSNNALFKTANGYVELIKSAKSREYDIVKICDYETYVAQGIDCENNIIIDMYGKDLLKIDEDAFVTIRDTNGKNIEFNKLDKWNVLSVAQSVDKTIVQIIVCGEVVEGIFNSVDFDEGISVEGEIFPLTSSLENNIKTENFKMPEKGEYILVYLDHTGKAAAIEKSNESVWKAGYLIAVGKKGGIDKEIQYKLLEQSGKISIGTFAKNLTVDNESYKNKDHSVLMDYIPENGTLIRYRLNRNGNIYQMDTPKKGADESEDSLRLTNACKGSIRSYVPCFLMEDKNIILVKQDAAAFVIPQEAGADEKKYKSGTVGSIFTSNDDEYFYNIETYRISSDAISEEIVISRDSSGTVMQEREVMTVIEKITRVINKDGAEVEKITGYNSTGRREWTFDEGESGIIIEKNLKPGDLVRIAANEDGVIGAVQKVFDYETRTVHNDMGGVNPSSVFDSVFRVSYGKALQRRDGFIQLMLYNDSQTVETCKDDGAVLIYEDGIVTRGTRDDIVFDKNGDVSSDIVTDLCWLNTRCIVVYR